MRSTWTISESLCRKIIIITPISHREPRYSRITRMGIFRYHKTDQNIENSAGNHDNVSIRTSGSDRDVENGNLASPTTLSNPKCPWGMVLMLYDSSRGVAEIVNFMFQLATRTLLFSLSPGARIRHKSNFFLDRLFEITHHHSIRNYLFYLFYLAKIRFRDFEIPCVSP